MQQLTEMCPWYTGGRRQTRHQARHSPISPIFRSYRLTGGLAAAFEACLALALLAILCYASLYNLFQARDHQFSLHEAWEKLE